MSWRGNYRFQTDDWNNNHLGMRFITELVRPYAVKSPRLFVVLLLIATWSPTLAPVSAEDSDDVPLIGFDFENGFTTNETTVITGFVEDEERPPHVTWSIGEEAELGSGDLSTTLEEADSSGSRPIWIWSLELDVAEYSPCTCYLTVTVESASGETSQARQVLFLGDTAKSAIILHSPASGDWVSNSLTASGWSSHPMVWTSPELRFFAKSASNAADVCMIEADSDFSSHLLVIIPDGSFSNSIDISGLYDGWHSFYAENYDPSGVTFAQTCVPIRVNNLAPAITLVGPDSVLEGSGNLLFDGSASNDPVWGREDMHYMWVLRRPSHTGSTPLDIVMGDGLGTYSMGSETSGEYTLTLRVMDAGGVSSTSVKTFTVENVIPTAKMYVDGSPVSDGDSIKLSPGGEWALDASASVDSANDQAGLRCVWKIDYAPMYEGCQRTLSWPSGAGDELILTLDVIDDDDEYGTVSVQLVNPDVSEPLPYPLIALAISAIFMVSAILLRYRSSDDSTSIPKWKSGDEN